MIGVRPISQARREPEPFVPDDDPETDEDMDALCTFIPPQVGGQQQDPPPEDTEQVTLGQTAPVDMMETTEQSGGPSSTVQLQRVTVARRS